MKPKLRSLLDPKSVFLSKALQQTRPQHLALREEVMAELTGLEMAWDRGVVPSNSADFCVKHGAPLDCTSLPILGATRKRFVGFVWVTRKFKNPFFFARVQLCRWKISLASAFRCTFHLILRYSGSKWS